MTSDLEATTDDLYNAIRDLWLEAQGGDDVSDGGFGQRVASVPDADVAAAVQLDLAAVREYLDNADGVKIIVEREGETRIVKGFV